MDEWIRRRTGDIKVRGSNPTAALTSFRNTDIDLLCHTPPGISTTFDPIWPGQGIVVLWGSFPGVVVLGGSRPRGWLPCVSGYVFSVPPPPSSCAIRGSFVILQIIRARRRFVVPFSAIHPCLDSLSPLRESFDVLLHY